MSTLQEISEIVEPLVHINDDDLGYEQRRQPKIISQVYGIYRNEIIKLEELKTELEKLQEFWVDHFAGKMSTKHYQQHPCNRTYTSTEAKKKVNTVDEVVKFSKLVKEQDLVVSYLEDIMKYVRGRGYDIRNIVEYLKYTQGSV